jgi:catechol 2,3-dioxygenase-like lactoylglutathione lyase family enzyme
MLDHYTLLVSDYDRSKTFYLAALASIGYALVMEFGPGQIPGLQHKFGGFGPGGKPYLWLKPSTSISPTHVAFTADNRAAVEAFYKAALAAGAKDNGPPGLRLHYHPSYFGAFVIDPDGYNIEVVCHKPE